jgi:DNA-binding transcriptional LysR family regulator
MIPLRNLRSLNLNQLPILRELLRQESITKAAKTLNLSQPAVSNILKSLRGHFEDELLAREGKQMARTPKGEELLVFLESALVRIESAIAGGQFDPATATGPIRIAVVDNLIGTFAGPMCRILAEEAPDLAVQFVFPTNDLASDLKSGAVDIAITSSLFMDSPVISESLHNEIHTQQLGVEKLVCIGRRDDPQLAGGLSLDTYLSRPHASYTVDPDHPHTIERQYMRDMNLNRATRISTSSNQSLLAIVAKSDCLAIVPLTMAKLGKKQYPIQIFKTPMNLPDIKWVVAWHERITDSPLNHWTLEAIFRCSKELEV